MPRTPTPPPERHSPARAGARRLAALLLLALAAAVAAADGAPPAAETPPAFKIYVEHPAVYRVGFEDLAAAGLETPLPSAGLGITGGGEPRPVWVEDGGDGTFGPGDWVELVGEPPRGTVSTWSEHTRYNVYFLRFDHPSPRRMTPGAVTPGSPASGVPAYRHRRHLERDLLILRLPPAEGDAPEELWYWAKLVHGQPPFEAALDLSHLDRRVGGTVDLRLQLRGWSRPRSKPSPETPDHRVEVSVGGEPVGATQWDGIRPHLLEIPGIAVERLAGGDGTLRIAVPVRPSGQDGQPLIDVVMLNWIEVDVPRDARVGEGQARFALPEPSGNPAPGAPMPLRLAGEKKRQVTVYGDRGSRTPVKVRRRPRGPAAVPAAGETAFHVAGGEHLAPPARVVRDRPSRLVDAGRQADYVILAHRTLLEAIEPLAEHHRARGLAVTVVDVDDVYDELSHGVVDPRAIRDFLAHAYHRWRRPAPRYVLLVGDASWDGKNEVTEDSNYADWTYRPNETVRFGKNASTPYPEGAGVNRRGLIPTWNHATYEGHSASDNYFVAVDGDDHLPEMAIGRLPVVEPAEVRAIVAKTLAYAASPETGDWRKSVLLITNESRGYQRQSDRLAAGLEERGYAPVKVYPASSEVSNEHHSRRLVESFDQGQLLVHFIGHGGRYIWRTGPPDLEKNHDLFTLDHLDQLTPTSRLPVVLSLTCYSAPFDHPSADSIGEKLLRLDGRGAVAVFAASWRNSPSAKWGEVLIEELTAPGATVGEAILRAKRRIGNRMFVATYNLLGDPAVPVALPADVGVVAAAPAATAAE